jgi:hypothetical protein
MSLFIMESGGILSKPGLELSGCMKIPALSSPYDLQDNKPVLLRSSTVSISERVSVKAVR